MGIRRSCRSTLSSMNSFMHSYIGTTIPDSSPTTVVVRQTQVIHSHCIQFPSFPNILYHDDANLTREPGAHRTRENFHSCWELPVTPQRCTTIGWICRTAPNAVSVPFPGSECRRTSACCTRRLRLMASPDSIRRAVQLPCDRPWHNV